MSLKSKTEIEDEVKANEIILNKYRNSFKNGEITKKEWLPKYVEYSSIISALRWTLGLNDRFD